MDQPLSMPRIARLLAALAIAAMPLASPGEPVQGCALLRLVDAMPMRRAQRRGAADGPLDCPDRGRA
jgi:hypothetical protein